MEIILLDHIVTKTFNTNTKVDTLINQFRKVFGNSYEHIINKKSIKNRIKTINIYKNKLVDLQKQPVIVQRSEEWYNIRNNLITASDFAQCLGKGKFGTKKQFFENKCGYQEVNIDFSIAPLQWGVRYEEVAKKVYESNMNIHVYEFGLMKHPTIDFVGASPDGISENGIMLEIKCPWKRKETETIPDQYYYQIQGQLEVCDLEECDYIECYFKEFQNELDFLEDEEVFYKGVVIKNYQDEYEYGELNDLEFHKDKEYSQIYLYGLKDVFQKRVYRDKQFFAEIINDIETVWNNVKIYKSDKNRYVSEIKPKQKTSSVKKSDKKLAFRFDPEED